MDFIKIPSHRYNDVILHLRESFFSDEPLNKAVNLCRRGEGHTELEKHSRSTLLDDLSVMAVTEEDEIAGVVLNGILYPGDLEKSKENLIYIKDENFKKIFNLLYDENLKLNLFNDFNVEKLFEIRILSVGSKYRGQGLAKQMLSKSEEIAREEGFILMKTDATGLFSQKISASMGFKTVLEISYNKYLDEENTKVFNVEPPHEKFKIMYKILD